VLDGAGGAGGAGGAEDEAGARAGAGEITEDILDFKFFDARGIGAYELFCRSRTCLVGFGANSIALVDDQYTHSHLKGISDSSVRRRYHHGTRCTGPHMSGGPKECGGKGGNTEKGVIEDLDKTDADHPLALLMASASFIA
jgi:hypothetical protein